MYFKETLVLQPRMNSLSSANLWRLSWETIKACSSVSINIPRYWSLVAGDEIHFSSLRKYPSPVNTLYTTYGAASAAFSLNFESRYSKLRDQKPCLPMISPISLPSIYKPQVIPILPKKWVEAIPVVWYINREFFQSKGIVVPTNHHPFHSRPNSSWDDVARRMWSYPLLSSIFGRNEPGYAYLGTETRVSNENGVSDIRKFTKRTSMHSLGLLGLMVFVR